MVDFSNLMNDDNQIFDLIKAEEKRQSDWMELIASENYQSKAVLEAQAGVFANKYSEWFPWRRYYWGQENTDKLEQLAIDRAKDIFHSDHANVQWMSGAAANVAIYAGLMNPWDTVLWMDLSHWWHLTHGAPVTFLSKVFNFVRYKTESDWSIDFAKLRELAIEHKPKIILAWFSAYPRELDYKKFVQIANEIWAVAFADMSHIGGLIAAWVLQNPLDYWFHVMMTTTHKSLRWPRWSLILTKGIVSNPLKKPEDTIDNIPTRIDRAVFPGTQWWPHMNTISAIAVALKEAKSDEFKQYAIQTLKNAQVMAEEFLNRGYKLVTGWTDNHMIIVDFYNTEIENWSIAEKTLDKIWISTSKSTIPDDPNPPFRPSGLRIWIPAMTTRWVKEDDTRKIDDIMDRALKNRNNENLLLNIKEEVRLFCENFPVPSC